MQHWILMTHVKNLGMSKISGLGNAKKEDFNPEIDTVSQLEPWFWRNHMMNKDPLNMNWNENVKLWNCQESSGTCRDGSRVNQNMARGRFDPWGSWWKYVDSWKAWFNLSIFGSVTSERRTCPCNDSTAWQVWLKSFVPCPWQLSGELCTILPRPQLQRWSLSLNESCTVATAC